MSLMSLNNLTYCIKKEKYPCLMSLRLFLSVDEIRDIYTWPEIHH